MILYILKIYYRILLLTSWFFMLMRISGYIFINRVLLGNIGVYFDVKKKFFFILLYNIIFY